MDENEIQQIIEKATEEIKKNGQVSAQTAKELEKAGQSLDKFAKTIGTTGQATQKLLQGFLNFTQSLSQGQRSINSMNSAVTGASSAASTALGKRGLAGAAAVAAMAGQAVAGAFNVLTKQLESFRSVGRVGALAADGLTGLQRQFVTSQLTLGQFEKVVGANSRTLAAFRGTTYQGAEDFSRALNQLTVSDLQNLGMGAEDIADLAAGFLERQTKLGRAQDMDTLELRRSTRGYIKELDVLSKITGVNREELQQQQLALLAENRFRAKYDQMRFGGQERAAEEMMKFVQGIQKYNPLLAAGVKDIFTAGTATTEAGMQAMMMGLKPIIDQVSRGQLDAIGGLQSAQGPVGEFTEKFRGITAIAGDNVSILNDLAGSADFARAEIADLAEATKTQADQLAGRDPLTNSAVEASRAVQRAAVSLDTLINTSLPVFAKLAQGLAKGLEFTVGTANILVQSAEIMLDPDSYVFPSAEKQAQAKQRNDENIAKGYNVDPLGISNAGVAIPMLAAGGPATANMPHIVGEKGPEIFVPDASGTIVPNHLVGGTTRMGAHPALTASANYMSSLTDLLSTLESNKVNIYTDKTGSRDELIASIEQFRNSMNNIAGDYNANVRSVNVGGVSQRYTTAGDLSLFNGSVSPMGGAQTMLDSILTSLLTEGKSEYDPALINEKFGYDSSRRLSGEAAERRSQEEIENIQRQTQQLDELISIMKRSLSTQERTASALQ